MNIRSFPHNFTILKIHIMDGAVFGEQITDQCDGIFPSHSMPLSLYSE
jgi:hypothetical protein